MHDSCNTVRMLAHAHITTATKDTPALLRAKDEIRQLLTQKDYPCVAAQYSFRNNECLVGHYAHFGQGSSWQALRRDLLHFLEKQKRSASTFLSYWAVFEEAPAPTNEEDFEAALWHELSCLTSEEEKNRDWQAGKTLNPESQEFRFSLAGSELFVVGLHAYSSRKSRRFFAPALVFNVFSQFEQLQASGQYERMVKTIRAREKKFEGSVNPMVEAHGETWESVQFSGRNNSLKWKCPFRFLFRAEKP